MENSFSSSGNGFSVRTKPQTLDWKEVEDKEEAEKLSIEWCEKHFGQLMATPLATKESREKLDPRKGGKILGQILCGEFKVGEDQPKEIRDFSMRQNVCGRRIHQES